MRQTALVTGNKEVGGGRWWWRRALKNENTRKTKNLCWRRRGRWPSVSRIPSSSTPSRHLSVDLLLFSLWITVYLRHEVVSIFSLLSLSFLKGFLLSLKKWPESTERTVTSYSASIPLDYWFTTWWMKEWVAWGREERDYKRPGSDKEKSRDSRQEVFLLFYSCPDPSSLFTTSSFISFFFVVFHVVFGPKLRTLFFVWCLMFRGKKVRDRASFEGSLTSSTGIYSSFFASLRRHASE